MPFLFPSGHNSIAASEEAVIDEEITDNKNKIK